MMPPVLVCPTTEVRDDKKKKTNMVDRVRIKLPLMAVCEKNYSQMLK